MRRSVFSVLQQWEAVHAVCEHADQRHDLPAGREPGQPEAYPRGAGSDGQRHAVERSAPSE